MDFEQKIISRFTAYTQLLESQAMALRADTLVSMSEGMRNDFVARELERVAKEIRRLCEEP